MNGWGERVGEWWWDRLDRVHDWRLDRTDRVADWWWDRVDGLEERRDRLTAELASWPLAHKLSAGGVLLVLVGLMAFLILGPVGLKRGGPPKVVADGSSRTAGAPVLPVNVRSSTTAPLPAPAPTSSTTVTSTTTVLAATTTVLAATTTTPPPTTAPAPPTTTRAPAATIPPSTPAQLASFCGFVPGAAVEIDVNGEPAGLETADTDGCVVVRRQLQLAP